MSRHVVWGFVLILMGIMTAVGYWALLFPTPPAAERADIMARRVADYLHAVVQANRAAYVTHVVEPLGAKALAGDAPRTRAEAVVPLPERFVHAAGRLAESKGIAYRLASLAPLNDMNAPRTEFERQGLDAVRRNPAAPHMGIVKVQEKQYFQAIYPEIATSQSCVACHTNSERRYRVGEVLGGLIITFPLYE